MAGDRSRELRRLAAECLTLARHISDSRARAALLEIAQKRLDLAELSEHDAWNQTLRLRALQAAIGKELHALYGVPRALPHRLLTLLMQLNSAQEAPEEESDSGHQAYVEFVNCIIPRHDQGAVRRADHQKYK
jgi:hypothetical protein